MMRQKRLMRFVKDNNYIGPHEALDMNTPAMVHDISTKPFSEKIPKYDCPADYKVLKMTEKGAIRWKSYNCGTLLLL